MANEGPFQRSVHERHSELRARLGTLFRVLPQDGAMQQKIKAASESFAAATNLRDILAKEDRPKWLQPLIQGLQSYAVNKGSATAAEKLMLAIGNYYHAMDNHEWVFQSDPEQLPDFDAVFDEYLRAGKIPELFDELVELLQKILACDEFVNRHVEKVLWQLIAALRKNRNGSYFAVLWTWNGVRSYLNFLLWRGVLKTPGLQVFAEAWQDMQEAIDARVVKLTTDFQQDLAKRVPPAQFPSVAYEPPALPHEPNEKSDVEPPQEGEAAGTD